MTTFVLSVLVSLATSFIAGDACNDVPSMTWGDACLNPETLRNGPDTAEVTVYARIAARLAKLKYESTIAAMDQTLAGGGSSLPGGEREAVGQCKDLYVGARGRMAGVADQLSGCDFTRARQDYLDAVSGITSCQSRLRSFKGSLPAMVAADLDLTMVAYDLGALIVGR
ncbi:hypothetical protein C2845_PM13G02680 [Panicum miliaceum]|uniref:Pectinesterase inhibitor domain-containing protein n=1 Tax=Panicum miliaceum TaxID=4540 RepID=A0A3L6RI72_PANMI|nr:hypothetical protein C2845_PM13G02680 [Panicum miliaceum]